MFSSLLADIIVVFGFPLVIGVCLVFLADFLKRRRNDEFLCALDQIINKENADEKIDKKSEE